jgi:SAM-dependent methyltransferase
VADGIADLSLPDEDGGRPESAVDHPGLARTFERYWRPALMALSTFQISHPDDEYEIYRRLLAPQPGDAILDVACGTGLFTRRLAREPGVLAIGAEPSRSMLEEAQALAREHAARPEFLRTPFPPLPLADQSFSGVLQGTSIHLFENPRELFREVGRVLKPGGKYIMSTVNPGAPIRFLVDKRPLNLHLRREDEWADLLLEAGLARVELAADRNLVVLCSQRAR